MTYTPKLSSIGHIVNIFTQNQWFKIVKDRLINNNIIHLYSLNLLG